VVPRATSEASEPSLVVIGASDGGVETLRQSRCRVGHRYSPGSLADEQARAISTTLSRVAETTLGRLEDCEHVEAGEDDQGTIDAGQ
jgi:hypothetical protein